MMIISEKSLVPLRWVLSGFLLGFSAVAAGAFWVASVNNRLANIETTLNSLASTKTKRNPSFSKPEKFAVNQ